jgi:hypothetical protein
MQHKLQPKRLVTLLSNNTALQKLMYTLRVLVLAAMQQFVLSQASTSK